MKHTCKTKGPSNCKPCMAWRTELWDAINQYVVACGGDPSKHVYGNVPRMNAVEDVESIVIRACNNDQVR
jgi:hypothetical protein